MIDAQDWEWEQKRLEEVTQQLQSRISELEPEVTGLHEQLTEIRKRFWEEVTVNTSTQEDFEETFYSINQQEALVSERERSHRMRKQQWSNLKRLLPSPYFGRIDFREEGEVADEPVYIGVASFVDKDGMNFLIYDWRTPIASMYYDCSPGAAAYDTPGGTIEGTMTLKRQFQIRSGQLQNVFDTSVTIGDQLLQQVLGKGADSQMRTIVATIQKEQNAIIRNDSSRMLIVQGAAGSGKTSAALQRVAYLLYKHRARLRADQIVLFSPNPMFNSYVSTVLPELGEENMEQATFQEYLEQGLGADFSLEDPFDQIEYVLTPGTEQGYDARLSGIRYKASEAYLSALQGYAEWLGSEGMRFKGIFFRKRELIGAHEMAAQFYSYDASIRLPNRISLLREWLLKRLGLLERKEREALWVQDEIEYLDKEQYADAYREILGKYEQDQPVFDDITAQYVEAYSDFAGREQGGEDVFDFAGQEEERLRRMIVKEQFKPLRRSVKRLEFVDTKGLYAQLFKEEQAYRTMTGGAGVPEHWPDICRQTLEKLDRNELFHEDATPFLYLRELIEGIRTNTEVRHVFIDEAQDYSQFQFEYLKKLFPRARMTVLGDFSQAIFTHSTNLQEADSPLLQLYGESETALIRLLRSYRSTREIVEFTKSLLPGGEGIMPFDRSGGKPLLVRTDGPEQRAERIVSDLTALKAEGHESVAVITKTAAESREAYDALTACGGERIRLVTKETPAFEKGIVVIPAYLAKGIEFDAVLIYDASSAAYSRESERKLFYTACTRAMHRLLLYADGEWNPYLSKVDAGLYEAR